MSDLHTIDVEVQTDHLEYDHAEISLSAGAWRFVNSVNTTDVWKANIDVAGIIARVALHAAPWITLSASRHGCMPTLLGSLSTDPMHLPLLSGCHISSTAPALLSPGDDLLESPTAFLIVPTAEVDTWIDRIRVWLETIARDAAARSATTRTAPTTATQLRLVRTDQEAS